MSEWKKDPSVDGYEYRDVGKHVREWRPLYYETENGELLENADGTPWRGLTPLQQLHRDIVAD